MLCYCCTVEQIVVAAAVTVDADVIINDFRTIFTGAKRHTYLDPDYSYTDTETELICRHKQIYIDFIDGLRKKRLGRLSAM